MTEIEVGDSFIVKEMETEVNKSILEKSPYEPGDRLTVSEKGIVEVYFEGYEFGLPHHFLRPANDTETYCTVEIRAL